MFSTERQYKMICMLIFFPNRLTDLYALGCLWSYMLLKFTPELCTRGFPRNCLNPVNLLALTNLKLGTRVILLDYGPYMDHGLVEYRVGSNPSATDFFCQCKRFEHCGIPCRHILKVQFCLCCQLVSDLFPDDIILTLLSVWLSGSDPSWFH